MAVHFIVNQNKGAKAEAEQANKKSPLKKVIYDPSKVVNLDKAVALYQKVHGTSSGSVYRVAGLSADVAMAVRLKSNQLSIRIIGRNGKEITQSMIADSPLSLKGGGYASAHMDISHPSLSSDLIATRIIGALRAELLSQWDTESPNIAKLKG